MLLLLIIVVVSAVLTTFVCSIVEAALYSVSLPYAKSCASDGSRSSQALLYLKENMTSSISGILIISTTANSIGPSVAGAMVTSLYGEKGLVVFAIFFSAAILYFGEILPKIIGVTYSKQVSRGVAIPVYVLITLLWPLINTLNWFSKKVQRADAPSVSSQEVLSITALGREEGTIDKLEGEVIENVLGLDQVLVRDILTPRVSLFRVEDSLTLGQIEQDLIGWNYTRVPLYHAGDTDTLTAYVRQRDLYRHIVKGNKHLTLREVARPLVTVPEIMTVDRLLLKMIESKDHICAVVDEHGGLAGIVSLEDIIEEIVGDEITDEYDVISKKGGRLSQRALHKRRFAASASINKDI